MKWPTVKLGDAYWFQEGPGIRNWQFTTSGIKLLNVGNIEKTGRINLAKTDRHISLEEASDKYKHFLCDEGDLVIASSGISIDEDGYLRTRGCFIERQHLPLCINTSTIRFKPLNNNNLSYLQHWLQSKEFRKQITKLVTGSAQLNFGPSHLKQLNISLPPLVEQKRIAVILDKANEIKAMRELAITRLDHLTQSTFLEMFGDPTINPKNWKTSQLKNLCSDIADIDHKMPKAVDNGLPFISAKDLVANKISFDNVKRISKEDFLHLSRKIKPCRGDIIYSRIGVNLGKARMVEVDFDFVASYSCCTIRPVADLINPVFLCKLLDSPSTLKQAHKGIRGIAVPDLGMGEIRNFQIITPPVELQKKYANLVDGQKNVHMYYEESLRNINKFIKSLQHQAFTTGFNA